MHLSATLALLVSLFCLLPATTLSAPTEDVPDQPELEQLDTLQSLFGLPGSELFEDDESLDYFEDDEDSEADPELTAQLTELSPFLDSSELEYIRHVRATKRRSKKKKARGGTPQICSSAMSKLGRMAGFAGKLLIENYNARRNTRAALSADVTQNPGKFCKSLWNRAQRIHIDLMVIEDELKRSHGSDNVFMLLSTIQNLKEALQEQMNIHGVRYTRSSLKRSVSKAKRAARTKGARSHIKNRAETGLDHIVMRLSGLNQGCQRWRRSSGKL